jgi:hypothetical protein
MAYQVSRSSLRRGPNREHRAPISSGWLRRGTSHRNTVRMASTCGLLVLVLAADVSFPSTAAGVTAMPPTTVSHYEASVDPSTLVAQGGAAGETGAGGLAILDFGRPAVDGSTSGTMDFGGNFISLGSIVAATLNYVRGYFASAPAALHLEVAIGTNNSCGAGQPCGTIVCGCKFEPPSFAAWGAQLAVTVEQTQSAVNSLRKRSGYTDLVTVVAGDDAEPAFDPEYQNTHDLLAGYANAVGGFQPAMVDFGSADPGFWSDDQLLQVADGFGPDVAVPEAYFSSEVSTWASLVSYAKSRGRVITVFGVLANTANGYSPRAGYASLLNAVQPITGQTSIRWSSDITH